jgi:hypothetical protein
MTDPFENDPFATAAPAAPSATPFATDTVIAPGTPVPGDEIKEVVPMDNTAVTNTPVQSEAMFSLTTKVSNDLLTVRGMTIEEFTSNCASLKAELTIVRELVADAHGVSVAPAHRQAAPAAAPAPQGGDAWNAPPAPVTQTSGQWGKEKSPPPGPAPACAHGHMKWLHRMNKSNQEYRGWFCSAPYGTPREAQCPKVAG